MSFEAIDKKKKQLDKLRPLPQNTLISLRENMLVEWTYNSNAIEGNTLTISETKVVLEGMTFSR
jgi:Fic family protein